MNRHSDYEPSEEEELIRELSRARGWFRKRLPRLLLIALATLVVLWFASGIYMVNPGHVGVVRTFGKETARTQPGLHYRFPWPFQRTDIVSVEQVRRIEVGFQAGKRVYEEALMLTGDENIVEAQMVIQYRVADPGKFLFRLHDPEATLRTATEVALRQHRWRDDHRRSDDRESR
jgi:modulator of FtsH protease HflK